MHLSATRCGRPLPTAVPRAIHGLSGSHILTIDVASAAAVRPVLAEAERHAQAWRRIPFNERVAIGARAGDLLWEAALDIGGSRLALQQTLTVVSGVTGLPHSAVLTGFKAIRDDLQRAEDILRAASPTGGCEIYSDPACIRPERTTHWVPAGDALAVIAPGNVVGVHAIWALLAVAGFPVVLRPSFNDPITPARVMAALLEAGAPGELCSFLPLDHVDAPILSRTAAASIAFGDEETLRRFPRLTRGFGPGRSVAIVTDTALLDDAVRAQVRQSILAEAGRGCVNCSTLVMIGDGSDGLRRLASELEVVAPKPLTDPGATLGALPESVARGWHERLETLAAEGALVHCPSARRDRWISRANGLTYLLPALLEIPSDWPARDWEAPAPVAWVVRWPETVLREGLAALPDARRFSALVAGQFVESPALFDSLCAHPRIGKVVCRRPTTNVDLAIPHDGMLTQGLYRPKAVLHG